MSIIQELIGDKEELERLKQIFLKIDKNQDGVLDHKEMTQARKELKKKNFKSKWKDLKKCDLDNDGKISFHEFLTAAADHQKSITYKNLKSAFDTFDINGDGSIDIEEFAQIMPDKITAKSDFLDGQKR